MDRNALQGDRDPVPYDRPSEIEAASFAIIKEELGRSF